MERIHRPVFINEVIEMIGINPGGSYADLTFGEGGHSLEILKRGAGSVLALDRDLSAIEQGQEGKPGNLKLIHSPFSSLLNYVSPGSLDGVLMDLGVSTKQILSSERGFSFQGTGPLDMRMDSTQGDSLYDYLRHVDEPTLVRDLQENGEIQGARSVAKKILLAVKENRLSSTADLARMMGPRRGAAHPATSLFMALRMAVNGELDEIRKGVPAAIEALRPGGRLVIITFHSVEDRLVKRLLQQASGKCICEMRICQCPRVPSVKILTSKPLTPSAEELRTNPRSRSAKLRCVEKVSG